MPAQELLEVQGARVPKLGFGTWQITGPACREAVRDALELGYRHLDTARVYENEAEVGAALRESGVGREEVFLTTKVWMDDAAPRPLKASAEASLRDLGSDYVDLLLLHWPNPGVPIEQTLAAMAALGEQGRIRHAGVSNFPPGHLRRAIGAAGQVGLRLFCDQVEHHPLLGQDELLALAAEHELMITAYAPFGHGAVLEEPVLAAIGEAHGKSVAQVALRWLLDQPLVSAVPKAASHENRAANLDVFDFELSEEERARIGALPKDQREFDPGWAPDWDD